eukprot:13264204-Alexandrium_andersonii.AAC.1
MRSGVHAQHLRSKRNLQRACASRHPNAPPPIFSPSLALRAPLRFGQGHARVARERTHVGPQLASGVLERLPLPGASARKARRNSQRRKPGRECPELDEEGPDEHGAQLSRRARVWGSSARTTQIPCRRRSGGTRVEGDPEGALGAALVPGATAPAALSRAGAGCRGAGCTGAGCTGAGCAGAGCGPALGASHAFAALPLVVKCPWVVGVLTPSHGRHSGVLTCSVNSRRASQAPPAALRIAHMCAIEIVIAVHPMHGCRPCTVQDGWHHPRSEPKSPTPTYTPAYTRVRAHTHTH